MFAQFAEWITYLHKQPCHVVYTDYRPTPLQHYIYPSGGDGIHLVVDEQVIRVERSLNVTLLNWDIPCTSRICFFMTSSKVCLLELSISRLVGGAFLRPG